ncbi:pyridoxal phosphate-dependent transferase [Spinellus fusiger]|nr:pyridoxal phosphate-dependent transferase [Spinellus fusiger]
MKNLPQSFGKVLRKDFFIEEGHIPLNNGAFGVHPLYVAEARIRYQRQAELNPERWLRRTVFTEIEKSKKILASIVHCDPEDIVFISNSTTAVNSLLRSPLFKPGDKLLHFNTAYNAVLKAIEFVNDNYGVELVQVDIKYPISDSEVLAATRNVLESYRGLPGDIRLCVMDAISSTPGVRFPFEAMTSLLKEYNVLSLIDGAHTLGHIPLNLDEVDCDFYLSNLHKWFFVPRPAAFIRVAKRNQHLVHPLTINSDYKSNKEGLNALTFRDEFGWPGTSDFSNFLCIEDAYEYRKTLGGEEAIIKYCHDLAVCGGDLVAKIFGTSVMEVPEKNLTACMVNVRLPLVQSRLSDSETGNFVFEKLLHEHNCTVYVYPHNDQWWVRLSPQVYNDLSDFEYVAKALLEVIKLLEK